MAVTVDALPVDPRVISAWKACIKTADEIVLQDFAKNHKQMNAGFRKGKVSLSVLLTRVQAMLDQSKEFPTDLCKLLRDATLSRKFICVLSEEAITFSLNELADAYGRLNIFAALQLDERESIRNLGNEKIQSWNGIEADESEQKQAVQDLQKLFPGFLIQIQALLPDRSFIEKASTETPPNTVHQRDKKTEKLISDLRATRTAFNRLRRDFNEAVITTERINLSCEAYSARLERTTQTLNLVTQNYNNIRDNFEQTVQDAVRIELDRKLIPWLGQSEMLEQAVNETPHDLQQDAENILKRQAAADKKFGLRFQLAAEANKCQALQILLKEALIESIQPLPELSRIVKRLENRISEIEKILKRNAVAQQDADQAPASFIEKLNTVQTLDELASIRKGLLFLEAIGLLNDSELSVTYALIGDKASRLYLKSIIGTTSKSQRAVLDGVPLYALQRQVTDGNSCVLLIDGHNVLHKLSDLFSESFERGIPGAKAQQALIKKIHGLCEVHANLTVKLWFDSTRTHDETIKGNFTVHYSGGTGQNRADDQIVAYLNFLRSQSSKSFRALVTDDRDEAAKAAECGALILSPLEFKVLLGD